MARGAKKVKKECFATRSWLSTFHFPPIPTKIPTTKKHDGFLFPLQFDRILRKITLFSFALLLIMTLPRKLAQVACRKFSPSTVLTGTAVSLTLLFADYRRRTHEEYRVRGGKSIFSKEEAFSPNVASCEFFLRDVPRKSRVARSKTIRRMKDTSTKETLRAKYNVRWKKPLGEGGFGTVYLGTDKSTKELVAVKKIPKKLTDNASFQKEMNAFLHIRQSGGHPNICGLRENFEEGDFYFLVLDLISGGEMFDHLCSNGAYSEADAARLVREVASALAFLHGTGIVHGDLKPENLMLSSEKSSHAVVKIVDFGCAQIIDSSTPLFEPAGVSVSRVSTPGYSPPEVLDKAKSQDLLDPSVDMFAMGVIIYIMLTGLHPFDLSGTSTNEDMNKRIQSKQPPPLRKSPITAHLSPSAIDLIQKLIDWNPKRRITAQQMLNHPWVQGETARTGKMADSDKRLSAYRAYKSRLEAKVFASMVEWSDNPQSVDVAKRSSLIERAFHMLDADQSGFITPGDLKNLNPKDTNFTKNDGGSDEDSQLSLSGFSDLISENMKSKYFPAGHTVYREGEKGHKMYFINSGRVEVSTKSGFRATTEQGDFFGEGALLNPRAIRSSTIRCLTPVHVIEINREYFEKYMADGYDAKLSLREKDKARKRNIAKSILQLQKNMAQETVGKGQYFFKEGEAGSEVFIIEEGKADVSVGDHTVFTVHPGELCGEHAILFGRPRNTAARCASETCKLQVLKASAFLKLMKSYPAVKESIRHNASRRDFQKALVFATKKSFPTREKELREAFEDADYNKSGSIDLPDVYVMLKDFDDAFTDADIKEILSSLDLDGSGSVNWEEFKRIFGISDATKEAGTYRNHA